MTAYTFENFAKNCMAAREAKEIYDRTEMVYNYLLNHKDEKFTPTELAQRLNEAKMYKFWIQSKDTVKNPLHILENMGLVGRESYKKIVNIECFGPVYKTDYKVIDGITYTGKILVHDDHFEKEVTMYRWFAL